MHKNKKHKNFQSINWACHVDDCPKWDKIE